MYAECLVVLYDMHIAVFVEGCGVCKDSQDQPAFGHQRYSVVWFGGLTLCKCGRIVGVAQNDRTYYNGPDQDQALEAFWRADEDLRSAA